MLIVLYTPSRICRPGRAGQGRKGRKGQRDRERESSCQLKPHPKPKHCIHIKIWEKDIIERQNLDLFNKSSLVGF
jgi:hypothetical protein